MIVWRGLRVMMLQKDVKTPFAIVLRPNHAVNGVATCHETRKVVVSFDLLRPRDPGKLKSTEGVYRSHPSHRGRRERPQADESAQILN
jgi:hypothetical protein